MANGLKLKAAEIEDISVFSAAIEGAITSPGELGYSAINRTFTLTASRFMWEQFQTSPENALRTRCGLLFSDVLSVKAQGISPDRPTEVLELLSITCTPGEDGSAILNLIFAGNAALRLSVECIDIALTDVGAPWETDKIPDHAETDKN
ncbi:DUF2948 family protein [Sneathiella aquimaris]|uniref:DUF2948 family protein n=1 Tax=Sneathiella aquimaris TaxID=2599305 RepID=UPI00146DF9CB|nr:DUF2948 family protein [Sneathiella aquimaris]